MKIDHRFAAWSSGELDDSELLSTLDSARVSIEEHKQRFAYVLDSLSREEEEHCAPLSGYCQEVMERLLALLEEARASVLSRDRARALSLADGMSRGSYQLDNALAEFRNQVLLVRGPTQVPSLNLIYSLVEAWESCPSAETFEKLMAGIESELVTAQTGARSLDVQTHETAGKGPLKRGFEELAGSLARLREELLARAEEAPDLSGHLLQLNMNYLEIHRIKPMVEMEFRDRGETEFSEINRLISLLDDVAEGRCGEEHLYDSLARFDSFIETLETCADEAGGLSTSEEGVERLSEALACFGEGMSAVERFQQQREIGHLMKAKDHFSDFGALLGHVQSGPSVDGYDVEVDEAPESSAVPEKIAVVLQAVDSFLVGRIGEEDYLKVINSLDHHLRVQMKGMKHEEVFSPVKSMLVGLKALRDYPASGDERVVREGVLSLHKGANALQMVLQA